MREYSAHAGAATAKCQVLHMCPNCNDAATKTLVEKDQFSFSALCDLLNTLRLRGYRRTCYFLHCGKCGHSFPPR